MGTAILKQDRIRILRNYALVVFISATLSSISVRMICIRGAGLGLMLPVYLNSSAILLFFLLAILSDLLLELGFKPSKFDVALVYISIYVSTSIGGIWLLAGSIGRAMFLSYQEPFRSLTAEYRPYFWAPPGKYLAKLMASPMSINWSVWTVPLLYWFSLAFLACLLAISAGRILAPVLVDLEEMPFPTITLYRGIRDSFKRDGLIRRIFLYSALVSFLINLPALIRLAVPWFPLFPFPQAYGYTMTIDLTAVRELRVFIAQNAVLVLSINPLWIAACYLLPLDTLLTWWIFYIIFNVVYPLLAVYSNLLPPLTLPFGARRIWVLQNFRYGLFMPYIAITVGGLISLGVVSIAKLFLLAKRTARKFLLLIALAIAGLSIVSAANRFSLGLIVLSLLSTILTMAIYLGILSLVGESFILPVMLARPFNAALGQYLSEYIGLSTSQAFVPVHVLGVLLLGEASYSVLAPGVALLESYRLIASPRYRPREVRRLRNSLAKLTILSVAVSLFSAYYTMISTAHEYSIGSLPGLKTIVFEYGKAEADFLMDAAKIMVSENWWTSLVFGMLFLSIVSLIRLKILAFPICPVGLVLSTSELSLYGMWFSALLAYILKRTTLALGGPRLYMREGRAIAVGVILGYSLSYIASSALSFALYFIH